MLTKNENYSLAKFGKMLSFCYHFVIIQRIDEHCDHLYDTIQHATHRGCKYLLVKFGKCYHFVIIVIDNILTRECTSWCLFLSFFWSQKMTFCTPPKHVTIMLSFFYHYYIKYFLLFFDSTLHKSQKISEKMDKNRCPKMRSTKHFWEKTCGAR